MKRFSKIMAAVAFAAMVVGSASSVVYARPGHHSARRMLETVNATCYQDGSRAEDGICDQNGICQSGGWCQGASEWCDGYGSRSYSHHSGRGHRSGHHN